MTPAERERERDQVNLPNWAVALLMGVILNMIMVAYSAGMIVNRLEILMERFDYLEIRFNEHLKDQHNMRGLPEHKGLLP